MRVSLTSLFDRLRFRQKLLLSYLVVVVVPILILGVYAYNQSKTMLEYQTLEGIDKNVATITDSIDNSLERYNRAVRAIVLNGTFQKIVVNDYLDLVNLSRDLNGYLTPYVNMMKNLDKDIVDITMYTQSKVPEYDKLVLSATRVDKEPWYAEAVSAPYGEYRWFYDDGLFVTSQFPRRFASTDTNIVQVRINQAQFFNVPDLQADNGIILANRQGRIVYANGAAHQLAGQDLSGVVRMEDGIVKAGGKRLFLATRQLRHADWVVCWFAPTSRISAGAGSIIRAMLGIILICILILFVIIALFSRTINRPIFALNAMMKRVEMGDLSLRVQSAAQDEIGELTNRFGRMLVRINELIEESYQSKLVQKEAELQALQWQINPHFLYNTLSFINWKALRGGSYEISHIVTSLSRFYRTALNRGRNIIPVRDELDNIRSYIEVIQIMNDYSFDVEYEIDAAVYEFHTVNLILQPLVENAIQHGVNQKREGRGLLQVAARLGDGTIVFEVEDNGPGMTKTETAEPSSQPASSAPSASSAAQPASAVQPPPSSGYGLNNVNDRLKLRFGPEYGVAVDSVVGRGTRITLTVPQYVHVERHA